MKYLTIAICFFAALFISPVPAGPSTDTSTFIFKPGDGSSVEHTHKSFMHPRSRPLWENHIQYFDHIVNNLDERITYLNSIAKSIYLISCSNAYTRPDECVRLAKILSEKIKHDHENAAMYCPFNSYHHLFKHAHDNQYLILPKHLHQFAIGVCGYQPKNAEHVDWLIERAKEHLDTGLYQYIYTCLLYTSPSPRDRQKSRMPSSA